jgi:hypothetical protein
MRASVPGFGVRVLYIWILPRAGEAAVIEIQITLLNDTIVVIKIRDYMVRVAKNSLSNITRHKKGYILVNKHTAQHSTEI